MSSSRTRPTREDTRRRLIDGAVAAFVEVGIGAATIEDVCSHAGLTRGAFYSNFATKDELVLAVLDEHVAFQVAEMERLYAAAPDGVAFLRSLEGIDRREGPLSERITLTMELTLYAIRSAENRPKIQELRRRWREPNERVLQGLADGAGVELPVPVEVAARFITALDEGYSLAELIEPGSVPKGEYSDVLVALQQLWLASAARRPVS